MIIASAIHYDDGKHHVHQPKNISIGFVVVGRRHHNCFMTVAILCEHAREKMIKFPNTQGFITKDNVFLNRQEAAEYAYKCGQTKENTQTLFSEDLW